jgi:hypothetical protein
MCTAVFGPRHLAESFVRHCSVVRDLSLSLTTLCECHGTTLPRELNQASEYRKVPPHFPNGSCEGNASRCVRRETWEKF